MNESAVTIYTTGGWWVIVTVIGTLIIAFVTAYVAYLNYRTRPLLVRTREKHSEDIKKVLERWAAQITGDGLRDLVPSLYSSHRINKPYLDVEEEILFLDLRAHIPENFNLLTDWEAFRKNCLEYNAGREELYKKISQDVKKAFTRPPIAGSEATDYFVKAIYEDAVSLAKGEKQHWLNSKMETNKVQLVAPPSLVYANLNGRMIVEAKYKNITEAETAEQQVNAAAGHLLMVLKNLSKKGTDESSYRVEARHLHQIETNLMQQHNKLLHDINDLLAIPILAGDCKYIRMAVEPLFPAPAWFKYKIKRLRG